MNYDEFVSLHKKLNKSGMDDDKIMAMFYDQFINGKLCQSDFEIMTHWMGIRLTDEFFKAHKIKRIHKNLK